MLSLTKEQFGYYIMLFCCDDLKIEQIEIIFFNNNYIGNPEINEVARLKDK